MSTLAELQTQVDAFDGIYYTERPHQGLPGRITPRTAWEATTKAEAPGPKPDPPFFVQAAAKRFRPAPPPKDLPAGTFVLAGVQYKVDGRGGLEQVLVVIDGEVLIEHTPPAPGVRYVGNGRPRGPRPNSDETPPKS